ncbi:hypothetical protein [Ktedonospora formicarum]|uniref:Uncharacterized protein n=1 Tax=Ktedonospora formicarum TaxID=2778364 RepID=A0A8J3I4K9_9CHLR|nr:hypothetical protein [Ktedonospora formicarum]GHO45319.1 hypothetical protein KSX_34820 [Ktedonospora formicarum]
MDSMLITYLGLIVALSILVWSAGVLFRYYRKPRSGVHGRSQNLDAWIPFNPTTATEEEYLEAIGEEDEESPARLHIQTRQNGHSNNGHKHTF